MDRDTKQTPNGPQHPPTNSDPRPQADQAENVNGETEAQADANGEHG